MESSFLSEDDVISVGNGYINVRLGMPPTFCAKEVKDRIRSLILKETKFDILDNSGCKVLRCDQPGWKAGAIKIKVEVEFFEDESANRKKGNDANMSSGLDHLRTFDVEQAEN